MNDRVDPTDMAGVSGPACASCCTQCQATDCSIVATDQRFYPVGKDGTRTKRGRRRVISPSPHIHPFFAFILRQLTSRDIRSQDFASVVGLNKNYLWRWGMGKHVYDPSIRMMQLLLHSLGYKMIIVPITENVDETRT